MNRWLQFERTARSSFEIDQQHCGGVLAITELYFCIVALLLRIDQHSQISLADIKCVLREA